MSNKAFVRYDFGRNCVCVGRTSTLEQSTTAQIRDLEKFANDMGYENVQPFFTSESGFIEYDDKQGWNQVVDFFEQNPDYRVLIVPEISRLSRRESILFKIKDYLIAKKIQLIIKDINFVLFNEWGEIPKGNDIVFSLYASLANSEMAQKKERFNRALRDYRLQGYAIGGKELFGYTRYYEMFNGKNRSRYKINEVEAAEIKQIYHWYAYGIDGDLSKTSILAITRECIARGFNKYFHSKRNVNKCLKEEAYCGRKETHNRIKNPDFWNYNKKDAPKYKEGQSFVCVYPPIFSGESLGLFHRVQERLIENNTRYCENVPVDKSRKHTTILSRLIPCPNCGRFLTGEYRMRKDGTPSFSYRCNQSRGVLNKCEYTSLIGMRLLDSVVWGYCKNEILLMIKKEANNNTSIKIRENEIMIENLQKKIDEFDYNGKIDREDTILKKKLDILKGAAIEHALEIYAENIQKIEKKFEDLTKDTGKRIDELKRENEALAQLSSFRDVFKQQELIASNKNKLYDYIHRLVKHIEIVYNHRHHTIIRIHLLGQEVSEYIYISKRSTLNIRAYKVSTYNSLLINLLRKEFDFLDEPRARKYFATYLPKNVNLSWNKDCNSFIIGNTAIPIEDLITKYRINDIQGSIPSDDESDFVHVEYNKWNQMVKDTQFLMNLISRYKQEECEIDSIPLLLNEIKFDMLNCYDLDIKSQP